MRNLSRLIGSVLWVCLAGVAVAQTTLHAVSGRVIGPQGLAIADATIKVFASNRILLAEVRSDEDGRFTISKLPEGRYELWVEASGFSPVQRVIAVPLASLHPLELRLQLTPLEYQVTVTAHHGTPEEPFREPASVSIRGSRELIQREVSHLPRMLAEEPGVLTQETTPGQGSPILRGQGAQTVLYLLDGIRFNNSTYRSGNTQYLGWIPTSSVDSVEVILGPAGTQYGSDALGGAVNVLSNLLPPWSDTLAWGGEWRTFVTTADLGAGSELRGTAAGRNVALTVAGFYKRPQELRAGQGEDSHNSLVRFLGFTPNQVRAILGARLPDTDYAQAGWSAKLGLRFRGDQFFTLNWIQSEQYGVRRYDRLLGGEGLLRSELSPQRLQFGYARYQKIAAGLLRSLHATFSLNRQTDGQVSRIREPSPLQDELTRVTALGYLLSTTWAPVRRHALTAGAEFYDEHVFSQRTEMSSSGIVQPIRPRFPNGTRYQSLGLYVWDDWEALPQRLVIDTGTRASSFRFQTRSDKNVFLSGMPTVPDATERFTDLTFTAGLSYSVSSSLAAFGRIARGFRAPTVFDLGEQGLTGGGFEVSPREAVAFNALIGDSGATTAVSTGRPWRDLKSESLWSFEAGLRWKSRRASGSVTVFDSELLASIQRRVLIVPVPVVGLQIGNEVITGQDTAGRIFVDLDSRPVVSRANVGHVRIQGVEASLRVDWSVQWSSALKAALQRGRELDTGHFARRIAPDTLFASLRWTSPNRGVWLEGFTEISAPQTRLNPAELDDPRIGALRTPQTIADFFNFGARRLGLVVNNRLTLTGETVNEVISRLLGASLAGEPLFRRTKSFLTLNLRGAWPLNERNEIFFALTNLTDANYRKHGSGFDAPGISLALSYRVTFR